MRKHVWLNSNPYVKEILSKPGMKGNFLNLIKCISKKTNSTHATMKCGKLAFWDQEQWKIFYFIL